MFGIKKVAIAFVFFACCALLISASAPAADIEGNTTYYLFAYFAQNDEFSGEGFHPGDGLYFAWSADGLSWEPVNGGEVVFRPRNVKGFRDPNVLQGPDGRFRMVWTGGGGKDPGIGYAVSDDLIDWEDRHIPVMAHEPDVRNVWAPELFYNDIDGRYIIHWASTIPGRFPETESLGDNRFNHRIYFTTTEDFEEFSPVRLLIEPGFNCIDANILKLGEKKYVMFLKNETLIPPQKNIVMAKAKNPEGPYGKASKPITAKGLWAEGPTSVFIGGRIFVYFDMYTNGRFGVLTSDNLKNWKDESDALVLPEGIRHGTVFPVSGEVLKKLLVHYGDTLQ